MGITDSSSKNLIVSTATLSLFSSAMGGHLGWRDVGYVLYFFCLRKCVMYLGGFSAHGFCRWFSISS
jgi:hypothetical protein